MRKDVRRTGAIVPCALFSKVHAKDTVERMLHVILCVREVYCIKWPSTAPKQPITWQINRTQTFYEGDFRSQEIKGVMEDWHTWRYDTKNYYLQHFFLPGFSCTRFKTLCINSSSLTCSILKQEGGSEGYPRQKKTDIRIRKIEYQIGVLTWKIPPSIPLCCTPFLRSFQCTRLCIPVRQVDIVRR